MYYQIDSYGQLDGRLVDDWRRLWEKAPSANFFNHPSWFLSCIKTFPEKSYNIIIVRREGFLVGVLPLVFERRFGIAVLAAPGGRHLAKSALLAGEPAAAEAAAGYLAEKYSLFLSELDEELANRLVRRLPGAVLQEASVNPYISLINDPYLFLSSKQRSKITNKIKKYGGRLAYRSFRGETAGLNLAFEMDKRVSKRREGKPVFPDEIDRQFFLQLLKEFGDMVVVDVLYYDGVPIVFSTGFSYGPVFHACNTAFDEKYKSMSPRKLLLFKMIERLRSEGFELLDMSRGASPLKREFTPLACRQYDVFFSLNPWIRQWWKLSGGAYRALQKNNLFYRTYLSGKGLAHRLKDYFYGT